MDFLGMGWPEIILICIVALIVVGPEKLPEYLRSLGKYYRKFRKMTDGVTKDFRDAIKLDDEDGEALSLTDELDSIKASLDDDANELKKSFTLDIDDLNEDLEEAKKGFDDSLEEAAEEVNESLEDIEDIDDIDDIDSDSENEEKPAEEPGPKIIHYDAQDELNQLNQQ